MAFRGKTQGPSQYEREYFVLVAVPDDLESPPRSFVVPRSNFAAAAWSEHMDWLTDPTVEAGKRNVPVDRARVKLATFEGYENRWVPLLVDKDETPVLLPCRFQGLAQDSRVGLPPQHSWNERLPCW